MSPGLHVHAIVTHPQSLNAVSCVLSERVYDREEEAVGNNLVMVDPGRRGGRRGGGR